jgi:hypothetical protein
VSWCCGLYVDAYAELVFVSVFTFMISIGVIFMMYVLLGTDKYPMNSYNSTLRNIKHGILVCTACMVLYPCVQLYTVGM